MIDIPKKAKKFVMKRHFEGLPTHDDFSLVEEDIPELKTGGETCSLYCPYLMIMM